MSEPGYKLFYHPAVVRQDIPRLDPPIRQKIKIMIEHKLLTHPEIYGVPLRGVLKGCWKLRVSDWRVVYIILRSEVKVLLIAHRSVIYSSATKIIEARK